MVQEIALKMEKLFCEKDFQTAINVLSEWLSQCHQGEPDALLAACAPAVRIRLRNLMSDVLSCYPKMFLGFPLLIMGGGKDEGDGFLNLPFPTAENEQPCLGLKFLGWLPCNTRLPVYFPFRQEYYSIEVERNVPTGYVGVFHMTSDEIEIDVKGIHPLWWGDLFLNRRQPDPASGEVRVEGNVLFSYPEALEVATAMQAGARGCSIPENWSFHESLRWAYDQGVAFQEKCSAK